MNSELHTITNSLEGIQDQRSARTDPILINTKTLLVRRIVESVGIAQNTIVWVGTGTSLTRGRTSGTSPSVAEEPIRTGGRRGIGS